MRRGLYATYGTPGVHSHDVEGVLWGHRIRNPTVKLKYLGRRLKQGSLSSTGRQKISSPEPPIRVYFDLRCSFFNYDNVRIRKVCAVPLITTSIQTVVDAISGKFLG